MSGGSISVTSAGVEHQSAAAGHRANMWLQCLAAIVLVSAAASREVFTNSFLVRFKRSVGHDEVHQLAQRHGFDNLGPVSAAADHVIYVNIPIDADHVCHDIVIGASGYAAGHLTSQASLFGAPA